MLVWSNLEFFINQDPLWKLFLRNRLFAIPCVFSIHSFHHLWNSSKSPLLKTLIGQQYCNIRFCLALIMTFLFYSFRFVEEGALGNQHFLTLSQEKQSQRLVFERELPGESLVCLHPDVWSDSHVSANILHRFSETPELWKSPDDALHPGPPLVITSEHVQKNLVLLDTPDFDTGEGDLYPNRAYAQPALKTSEVLIYVFTNSV